MIPEYLAIGFTLALMTYTFHSLLEIYFMLREYKETKQPGQPGGLYQWCDARAIRQKDFTKWRWWFIFITLKKETILPALNVEGLRSRLSRPRHAQRVEQQKPHREDHQILACAPIWGATPIRATRFYWSDLPGYKHTRSIEICQINGFGEPPYWQTFIFSFN